MKVDNRYKSTIFPRDGYIDYNASSQKRQKCWRIFLKEICLSKPT